MNEPSLHKFCASVPPGGWILYNGDEFPAEFDRDGVHILACSFTRVAGELGDSRAGNMVALGALLAIASELPQESVDTALGRLVKSPRWLELDERAITRGRELLHDWLEEESHAV
jgi:Pyruvate/2-oxoacid:ferredoxin oxidoreductase gamma subunit